MCLHVCVTACLSTFVCVWIYVCMYMHVRVQPCTCMYFLTFVSNSELRDILGGAGGSASIEYAGGGPTCLPGSW